MTLNSDVKIMPTFDAEYLSTSNGRRLSHL